MPEPRLCAAPAAAVAELGLSLQTLTALAQQHSVADWQGVVQFNVQCCRPQITHYVQFHWRSIYRRTTGGMPRMRRPLASVMRALWSATRRGCASRSGWPLMRSAPAACVAACASVNR